MSLFNLDLFLAQARRRRWLWVVLAILLLVLLVLVLFHSWHDAVEQWTEFVCVMIVLVAAAVRLKARSGHEPLISRPARGPPKRTRLPSLRPKGLISSPLRL